jgi:hypothetical protein
MSCNEFLPIRKDRDINQTDTKDVFKAINYLIKQTNAQVKQLKNNSHKGDFIQYAESKETYVEDLYNEIQYHLAKLRIAINNKDTELMEEYAADICNCTLFLMINQKLL